MRSRAITSDSDTCSADPPSCSPHYGLVVTIVASDPNQLPERTTTTGQGAVVHGVLADRAQQGTYEATPAVAAHNQQVRALGLLDKHFGRMTALHQLVHHNIGMRG